MDQPLDPLPPARAPHAPAPVTVGVVGAGNRAQSHLATVVALQRAGYYRFAGLFDVDPQRREAAAAKFGTRAHSSLEALLDALGRDPPAVVVVVTPPDAHHPVVELAAARGVHALVETPLSFSLEGADRMIAAARRAGTRLETAENVWRFPEERAKRAVLDAGLLGEVTLIQVRYMSGSYHGMNAARHLARAPVARVAGDVATMATPLQRTAGGGEAREVEWQGALLRFANGVRGVFQMPVRPGSGNHWEVDAAEGCFEGGVLRLGGADGPRASPERVLERRGELEALAAVRYSIDGRVWEWENPFRHLPVGAGTDDVARADLHLSLHRAAVGAGDNDYPGEQGRADLAAVFAIQESALRGGAAVPVPPDAPSLAEQALREAYERRNGFPPEEAVRHMDRVFPRHYPMVRGG